ncbi:triose-phosphate isomerase [Salisaeta longa]|uniref:triose-phosphate isomerase n=1 Tax=Salisaeta longa TaxID=503170 RepID=UPI0003B5A2AA|nr:triose-phosphate isomerase [Salisaeta longa]
MLIAGNWKMNTTLPEATALAEDLAAYVHEHADALAATHMAVCPPFVNLEATARALADTDVAVGGQTMHTADAGSYTGETSAPMLRAAGCTYVIVGHSERRKYFGETDADVGAKVAQAHAHSLIPIVCVGETKAQRDAGDAEAIVEQQVRGALAEAQGAAPTDLVVAYEPVWAIGTGDSATPEQAQAMHAFIRSLLHDLVGDGAADVHLLYGGSMKPHNAEALLSQPDVDGGLIGGASLQADSFGAIAQIGAAQAA